MRPIRLFISLLNSGFLRRSFSIFLMLWRTVVWCFPPNFLPISGRETLAISLDRYMATCRGKATLGELFFDFNWESLSLYWCQTSFWIFSTVTTVAKDSNRLFSASLAMSRSTFSPFKEA